MSRIFRALSGNSPREVDEDGFVTAVPAAAVQPDQVTAVKLAGRRVILTRWQDTLIAFDAVCPHAAADLSGGELHRGRITCPDHEYKFDLTTGRVLWPPDEMFRLKRYEVKEEEGVVKVKII